MESEFFKKLPLWIPSKERTIGIKEFRRPGRLPIKIYITATQIDQENEERFWNITYERIEHEIQIDNDGPGDRISIDVILETDIDSLDFTARDQDFNNACRLMHEHLEKNGIMERYNQTRILNDMVKEKSHEIDKMIGLQAKLI
jgi:hypothetical protein